MKQVIWELTKKLQTIPETIEMARVTGLSISDSIYKAQMIRVQVSDDCLSLQTYKNFKQFNQSQNYKFICLINFILVLGLEDL